MTKGGQDGRKAIDEPPFYRVNLSKNQWAAIAVVLNAESSGRDTTAARAVLRRQRLVAELLAQDTQPGTLGSPLPPRAFVLPLTIRQFKALNAVLHPDNTKDKTRQQAMQQRAREVLARMPLVAYPSADYPRLSPPLVEQYQRDPRPKKVARFKPGDTPPAGFTFFDDNGQPTTFEAWLAGQSRYNPTSLFPYFGSKSKLAPYYPAPEFRHVIESFAGGASYSLLYADHDVWLNDLNPQVVSLWQFLLRKDALKVIRNRVPLSVKAGTAIDDLTKETDPEGLVWLMRSQAAQGSFGGKSVRRTVSPFGAEAWDTFRQRLEYWIPRIAHWKVTRLPYEALPNRQATWFIDPPYKNAAGTTYAKGSKDIDFDKLGAWCKSRRGQAIVCENVGATWLPFKTLVDKRRGIYNADVTSTVGELIWTQHDENIGLWAE